MIKLGDSNTGSVLPMGDRIKAEFTSVRAEACGEWQASLVGVGPERNENGGPLRGLRHEHPFGAIRARAMGLLFGWQ